MGQDRTGQELVGAGKDRSGIKQYRIGGDGIGQDRKGDMLGWNMI